MHKVRQIILIAHNLRSCHNVGSLLRTADGLAIQHVYLTGYTPYPKTPNDQRLPHEAAKIHKRITKTALGAEATVAWQQQHDIFNLVASLKQAGYTVAALEQAADSMSLPDWVKPPSKVCLVLGRETFGVEPDVLAACDHTIEIPMLGQKESYNVVQAAAMALYHLRFTKS